MDFYSEHNLNMALNDLNRWPFLFSKDDPENRLYLWIIPEIRRKRCASGNIYALCIGKFNANGEAYNKTFPNMKKCEAYIRWDKAPKWMREQIRKASNHDK